MQFRTLNNKTRKIKNAKKYLIKWGEKSRSKLQFNVKSFLKKYWSTDVVFEEFPIVGTRLSLDFFNANKRIAIEVQGNQHTKYVEFFHGNRMNFLHQLNRDRTKEIFCEKNNITLVFVFENEEISEKLFEDQNINL